MKKKSSTDLVRIIGKDAFTDSLSISVEFGRPHFRVLKSIKGLIKRGKLTTGVVVSSWIDSTGRSNEMLILDERSAYIAMPFIGGEKSEAGQVLLVDSFLKARKELWRLRTNSQDPAWIEARTTGKIARLEETDEVKAFVAYATEHGSTHAEWYYKSITEGTYKALYMLEHGGKWKDLRAKLSVLQLTTLATAERIACKYLAEGVKLEMPYKDIYKYAIAKVSGFADIIGVSVVPNESPLKLVKE